MQVCDEGHRLKAKGGNKTVDSLLALNCAKRVVLTGALCTVLRVIITALQAAPFPQCQMRGEVIVQALSTLASLSLWHAEVCCAVLQEHPCRITWMSFTPCCHLLSLVCWAPFLRSSVCTVSRVPCAVRLIRQRPAHAIAVLTAPHMAHFVFVPRSWVGMLTLLLVLVLCR